VKSTLLPRALGSSNHPIDHPRDDPRRGARLSRLEDLFQPFVKQDTEHEPRRAGDIDRLCFRSQRLQVDIVERFNKLEPAVRPVRPRQDDIGNGSDGFRSQFCCVAGGFDDRP
jgi:hypothetical protein